MLEHIDHATQFMEGKSLTDLEKDAMLRYAVVASRLGSWLLFH